MAVQPRPASVVRTAIGFELLLAAAAVLLGVAGGIRPWSTWRWDLADFVIGLVATIPLLVGMTLLPRLPWQPIRRLLREVEQTIVPLFRGCSPVDFALIALAAACGEELFFRGAAQTLFVHWVGLPVGLAAASALFGVAHFLTPTYAIIAAAVGLYIGGLFAVTGNLLTPVVVHALYDFLALLFWIRHRPSEGDDDHPPVEER